MSRGPAKQFNPDQAVHDAMKVFWAKGYVGSGMNELLGAMGISRKSLYDTFGSKHGLFLCALDRYADKFIGRIVKILDADGSPLSNVREALEQFSTAKSKTPNNGCLIGVGMGQFRSDEPEVAAALRGHLQTMEDAFHRAFKRAIESGELSSKAKPRDFARLLTATAQGLALRRRVDQEPAMSRSVVRATMATLEALRPADTSGDK